MSNQSLSESFIRAIINFPKYALEYTMGLIVTVINDFALTTLALAGVTVGLTFSSVFAGLATFFVLYAILRIAVNVGEAIAFAGNSVAAGARDSGAHIAQALAPAPPTFATAGDIMDGLFDQSTKVDAEPS